MKLLYRRLVGSVAASSLALSPLAGRANPLGGQVTAGSATITGQNTSEVTVNQTTSRAVIDWRSFNLAPGDTTRFQQPDSGSVTLNRVTGGTGASQIEGTITANGSVYVINPDGILFGAKATVNVGSFLATSHDIRNDDFMAERNNFTISGNPSASIVNRGTITAAEGGFAALVAPGVRNDGIITAKLGTVALASGNGFTLDLYGDGLIKLQTGDAIAAEVRDVATGQPLQSLVQNTGTLRANGGKVALTAAGAKRVLDSVINSSGVIEANTIGTHRGMIVFGAATADTKPAGAPRQLVRVSGRVRAAGREPGTRGGTVQITGEHIALNDISIDASGASGGGRILVGGDYHGGVADADSLARYRFAMEPSAVATATTVSAGSSVRLDASATQNGDGGKVIVWSNDTTSFAGQIAARGGPDGGSGGFAEVSGKSRVDFAGMQADLAASRGQPGTILFDPDIEVISQEKAVTISQILSSGTSVTERADQIDLNYNIVKEGGGATTFALTASQINIGSGVIVGSNAGPLSIQLNTVPYNITEQQNALESILRSADAAGLTPADLTRIISNHALPYNGSYQQALTYQVIADLVQYVPTDVRSSFAYNIISHPSINIGAGVQFYTNGGSLNVTRSDGIVSAFLYGTSYLGTQNTCASRGYICGISFSRIGQNSATLGVEWTKEYTASTGDRYLAINADYSFTIGGGIPGISSTNYQVSSASSADYAPLQTALPNLQISFGVLPSGIGIGTPVSPVAPIGSTGPLENIKTFLEYNVNLIYANNDFENLIPLPTTKSITNEPQNKLMKNFGDRQDLTDADKANLTLNGIDFLSDFARERGYLFFGQQLSRFGKFVEYAEPFSILTQSLAAKPPSDTNEFGSNFALASIAIPLSLFKISVDATATYIKISNKALSPNISLDETRLDAEIRQAESILERIKETFRERSR